MPLLDRLETLKQRRIELEISINNNRSQLSSLSSALNTLTNKRNELQVQLTNLQNEKNALLALKS